MRQGQPRPSLHLSSVAPTLPGPADAKPNAAHPHWCSRLSDWAYDYTHPEYVGFYSLEKLYAFQAAPPSTLSGQLTCLCAAMLPTIVVVTGLELIPLQDPTLPWTQNPGFYVRQLVRAWLIAVSGNIQIQELIPKLRQSWLRLILLSLVQILSYITTIVCIAQAFGIFPVPFSALIPILPTTIVSIVIRFVFVKGVLERNPELKPVHERMEKMTGFTFSLILLYCVYGFVFRRVQNYAQILLSVALYVVKQSVKHRMWDISHILDHHDLSAESVSCGVHLFHALYVTMFLQTARSAGTLVIVLVLNLIQDVLAYRSLRRISHEVDAILKELKSCGITTSPFQAQWTAQWRTDDRQPSPDSDQRSDQEAVARSPIMTLQSAYFRYRQTSLNTTDARIEPTTTSQPRGSSKRQERATQAVANLLHCRELMLIRLFVDVFVPLFYLGYCIAMRYMPNGHWNYFENLAGLDRRTILQLASSVCLLVMVKLIVLFEVCQLFRAHGQPSGMHQLAFVVKAQRWSMQTWFVMNFLQLVDFPLAHMGNDLSFRFEWLRKKH